MVEARALVVSLLVILVLVSPGGACACAFVATSVASGPAAPGGGPLSTSASLRPSCCCEECGAVQQMGGATPALPVRPELKLGSAQELLRAADVAAPHAEPPGLVPSGEVRLAALRERGGIAHLCCFRR